MKAKKSLGQHFLKSEKALRSIIDAGDVRDRDVVLEIGPGTGILTERLLNLSAKVIAVEKDDELHESLREKFKEEIQKGKLDLIHGDILEFDPNSMEVYHDFTYKLIANIPYNITGAIIEKFLSADHQPKKIVLLVQKEVAERIVGKVGKHGVFTKESILSLSVKAYGEPKYIETVKAGSFAPAPQVDSAIIAIEGISKDFFLHVREKEFFNALHAGFKSKRKKLSSNLSLIYDKERVLNAFKELKLDENTRAEDVNIETWGKIVENIL